MVDKNSQENGNPKADHDVAIDENTNKRNLFLSAIKKQTKVISHIGQIFEGGIFLGVDYTMLSVIEIFSII